MFIVNRRLVSRCELFAAIVIGTVVMVTLPESLAKANQVESGGFAQADVSAMRRAITDLIDTFGPRYNEGAYFLGRLDLLETQLAGLHGTPAKGSGKDSDEMSQVLEAIAELKNEALLANPLLIDQPILFVVRPQYKPDHHNSATMFQTEEINANSFQGGGALKTIDFANHAVVKTLIDLPEGIVRDPDVHFNAQKILVSMRNNSSDDYHLYEFDIDGSTGKQLTFGEGVSDIDPIYLPDGKILFTSTREPKYCQCNRHIMGNLFTIDSDGNHLDQIGHSTLHEGHAALLPDGRVLYDRWEYVDRNFGDAQGLWTVNPDGTNHSVYYGNNTASPGGVIDGRAVPNTEFVLATFSSCHDRPWGALALVDQRRGLDGRQAVLRTWPAEAIELVDVGNYDTFKQVQPKYEDPFPLSANYFLCSRMTGDGEQMGIYLLDVFGNEILLHTESSSCFDPMPLMQRPTPPALASRVDLTKQDGTFYVGDVYVGSGMDQVQRGTVKSLRVVEVPEKRFWTQESWDGSGTQAPAMAFDDFNNKRILGTVPVESDGSVYFSVPADRFVYFQLLDGDGMMVQSMRSGTMVRPGETTGCVGCHDNRHETVVPGLASLAMKRPPSPLTPWYGPVRNFNYTQEVQPVFDQHCTKCHDYDQDAGERLNLAGDRGLVFNTSYFELRSKKWVSTVGAGPASIQSPKSWGSHASRLAKVIRQGHGDPKIDQTIQLDTEAKDRIFTWIDMNAPYYPDYGSAYPGNGYGRSPLDNAQLTRLSELTGLELNKQENASSISFTRPELSPCLASLQRNDPMGYLEALELIQTGGERLAERPRADMPGFRLDGMDAVREKKYQASKEEHAEIRRAASHD